MTCMRFSSPINPLDLESFLSPLWIGSPGPKRKTTKDMGLTTTSTGYYFAYDISYCLRPTCATIKHHKQLCPTFQRSPIPSVNQPTILLGLTSHRQSSVVLPLCCFRLKSSDYWARLTVSRGSFICLPTLENGYKVQQKGFTINVIDELPASEA
ncbi:hypothetical protein K443DRAFT_272429 [Laccaria amethystina LaAM-08-1]|uniref:Uncharacterized protein n=1 Tax=Laccaria amethystina LaAM-08-1 TaxID=1095629 RepID=A0A0C9XGI1_9AGAR|nr:hypothetical protein K443DRAFT_272429 [Laccaria amethystina LaAM-08-1]